MPRLTAHHATLFLDDRPWLMRAGELQYFRLDRKQWERRLREMRALGFNAVTTYIPWIWHEIASGHYDFAGATDRRRNLAGFLRAAQAEGLPVVVRPGPYINAEYAGFGYPRWLAGQNPQARMRGPDGTPIGGDGWDAFALNHPAHRAAVEGWYEAVALVLAEFWDRPVIAWQLDNETGFLQMNGLGRWDWNPDTVARFHTWLAQSYGDVAALNTAWGTHWPGFAAIAPPRPPFQQGLVNDWQHFLEDEVVSYLAGLAEIARAAGVPVPLSHNESGNFQSPSAPAAKAHTPGLDLYGYDLYVKMSGTGVPADLPWAATIVPPLFRALTPADQPLLCWELGTGWFDPRSRLDDTVLVQTLAGGLAHGLGGFSFYVVQDGVEPEGHVYAYQTIWDRDGAPGPRHAIAARLLAFLQAHEATLLGVGGWGLGVGESAIAEPDSTSNIQNPQPPSPSPQPPAPTVGVAFYGPDARFAAADFLPGLPLQEPARVFAGLLGTSGVIGAVTAAGYGPGLRFLDLERAAPEELAACRVLLLVSRGRLDPATYARLEAYVAAGGHLVTCGRTPRHTLQGGPLDSAALYPYAPTGARLPDRASSLLHLGYGWGVEYALRERAGLIAQHPTSAPLLDAFEPLRVLLNAPQSGFMLTGPGGQGGVRGDYVLETYRAGEGVLLRHKAAPAAYRTRHGAGTSTMIGTLVGGAYATPAYYTLRPAERAGIRNFWRGVFRERGVAPPVRTNPGLEVAVQLRSIPGGALLVVSNPRAERQQGRFALAGPVESCVVLFSGANSDLRRRADHFAVDLAPGDAVVARIGF
jgi:hypothetical protein